MKDVIVAFLTDAKMRDTVALTPIVSSVSVGQPWTI